MEKQKYTAIVLAAGSGKRMNSKVHKQYLIIQDRPVLYYSLKAFEDSAVDEIVLVVGKGEEKFCRKEIVDKYGISKVKAIVEGGKERYHSVFEGLKQTSDADYVLIHDGARPFVNQDIIRRCMQEVQKYQACVVGMPVKDTIKIADEEGYAKQTPDRKNVWMIQTPVLGDKAVVDGIVEVAHVGGRVGLVADGHGVGAAFDHLGVGDRDDDTDDHEDDGDGDIQGIAAAILRLLVLFALCPGIDVTACQILLAALLFSGCTHLFVQSSQLLGFADLQRCY